jgi:hypothetical protein
VSLAHLALPWIVAELWIDLLLPKPFTKYAINSITSAPFANCPTFNLRRLDELSRENPVRGPVLHLLLLKYLPVSRLKYSRRLELSSLKARLGEFDGVAWGKTRGRI